MSKFCLNCLDRKLACHDNCIRYQKYKQERIEISQMKNDTYKKILVTANKTRGRKKGGNV